MFWNSLNELTLNGPVPIGLERICSIETWHGYTGDRPEASMASSEGCGRFRWMVTSYSPSALTKSRLRYHEARGLRFSRCEDLSVKSSKVQITSREVKGRPSCHFTFSCNLKVSALPSALQFHDLASSGRMVFSEFCGSCWSKITRLLNTGMNGMTVEIVASSWIDALGGLS